MLTELFAGHAFVLVLLVFSRLPRWGRSVLAFLRDLDDYRANRPKP